MKRFWLGMLLVLSAVLSLAVACGATPTPQAVVQTVLVEKEKVVQQTVLVEKEKVVQQTVVVQQTKIVEKEKVVQPTPAMQEGGQMNFYWQFYEVLGPFSGHRVPRLIFGRLVDADVDGSLYPNLAEKWEVNKDATQFTFNIRKGVKWHDGQPFTAKDVIFTVKYLCAKASADAGAAMSSQCRPTTWGAIKGAKEFTDGTATDIQGLQLKDDNTIVMTLAEPNVGWLLTNISQRYIVPEHIYKNVKQADLKEEHAAIYYKPDIQVGTGPYKFVSAQDEKFVQLVRNDDFWGGKPHVKDLIFKNFGEADTALLALQKGELDFLAVTGNFYKQAKQLSNVDVVTFKRPYQRQLAINLHRPYFQDVRVRQAISAAIDRQALCDGPSAGLCEPRYTFMENDKWTNANVDKYPYDPAKAKELLAAAAKDGKWDPNKEIELAYYYPGNDARDFMAAVQQYFIAAGFKTRLAYYESAPASEKTQKLDYDLMYGGGGFPADPSAYEGWFSCDSETGVFQKAMPETCQKMAALFKQLRSTGDETERRKVSDELQMVFSKELPFVPLYRLLIAMSINKRIGGFDQGAQAWITSWEYANFHAQDWFIRTGAK